MLRVLWFLAKLWLAFHVLAVFLLLAGMPA